MLKQLGTFQVGMGLRRINESVVEFTVAQVGHVEFLSRLDNPFRSQPQIEGSKVELEGVGNTVNLRRPWRGPLASRQRGIGEQIGGPNAHRRRDLP